MPCVALPSMTRRAFALPARRADPRCRLVRPLASRRSPIRTAKSCVRGCGGVNSPTHPIALMSSCGTVAGAIVHGPPSSAGFGISGFWVRQLLAAHRESARWSISLHYRIASLQGRIAVDWCGTLGPAGRGPHIVDRGASPHAFGMFVVTEAEAAAIRAAFNRGGELSAAVELRRLFPGVTDNTQARACARTIAAWKPVRPLPDPTPR
jgi:hypothetical protein